MDPQYELAETMYVLSEQISPSDTRIIMRKKTAIMFTSVEKFEAFHKTLDLGGEEGVSMLKGWDAILKAAEHLKRCRCTHVGIDPEGDRFGALEIERLIQDLGSLKLYRDKGYGSSQS